MRRQNRRCKLFPYTTIFRSAAAHSRRAHHARQQILFFVLVVHAGEEEDLLPRSEEHTSELQSRLHIVCRLLLEKKNESDHLRIIDTPVRNTGFGQSRG